jgi:hypothetical protein
MQTLQRYLATWEDGIERVIHAQSITAACDLAFALVAPCRLRNVQRLRPE